jgi:hypothetical protein
MIRNEFHARPKRPDAQKLSATPRRVYGDDR